MTTFCPLLYKKLLPDSYSKANDDVVWFHQSAKKMPRGVIKQDKMYKYGLFMSKRF